MPTPATAADFAAAVYAAGLLSDVQAKKLTPAAYAKVPNAESIARQLVKLGWLTAFQAKLLLDGDPVTFGKYRLLDKLGEGGMGQVFKAQDLKLGRLVALKTIRGDYVNHPQAMKRFDREARAAAALSHPHIVTLYAADEVNGVRYLAMEFIAGADLSQLVQAEGKLPLPQACDYVRQAALGLAHAHAAGLVHRDVKPANLLLAKAPSGAGSSPSLYPWGQVKVSDLGLARLHVAVDSGATKDGVMIGTIDYMAPEQARDASGVDAKADLYSLGCTLFHLLTGKMPYAGETVINKMLAHQTDAVPKLREALPTAPEGLEKLLHSLLAKEAKDRPANAGAVADALEPFCNADSKSAAVPKLPSPNKVVGLSASEAAETERYEASDSGWRAEEALWGTRRRILLIAVGIVAVGLLAWLAWLNNADVLRRYASVPVFTMATPSASSPIPALPTAAAGDSEAKLPQPDADGWLSLWNGQDLAGWKPVIIEPRGGGFQVVRRHGAATLHLPPGLVGTLSYATPLKSFTLKAEYVLEDAPALGANQPPLVKFYCIGDPTEKALGQLPGFAVPLGGPKRGRVEAQPADSHLQGKLLEENDPPPLRPLPEWNLLEIRTKGAGASQFLNGQLVHSAMSLRSKLLGAELPLAGGKVQIVAGGQPAYFRSIKVKPAP